MQRDPRALREHELAAVDRGLPREHPQQRRLARAVAPGQRQALPALELERDAAQERLPHHVLGEVGGDDDGHAHHDGTDASAYRSAGYERAASVTTVFSSDRLLLLALSARRARARRRGPRRRRGLVRRDDDKVVTNAGFILIAGFPLLIVSCSSMLQWRAGQAQGRAQAGREGAPRARRPCAAAGSPRRRRAVVRYERPGAAALVTIDRPERRNAIDGPTAEALHDAFRRFVADDEARVLVLARRRATTRSAPAPTSRRSRRWGRGSTARGAARLHPAGLAEADDRGDLRLVPRGRLRARALVRPARRHAERALRLHRAALRRPADRRRHAAAAADRRQRPRARPRPQRAASSTPRRRGASASSPRSSPPARTSSARWRWPSGSPPFPQDTMLSDRRAVLEGAGLPLVQGLALEAQLGRGRHGTALAGRPALRRRRGPPRRGHRHLAPSAQLRPRTGYRSSCDAQTRHPHPAGRWPPSAPWPRRPRRQLRRVRLRELRQPVVEQRARHRHQRRRDAARAAPRWATRVGGGARVPLGATGTTTLHRPGRDDDRRLHAHAPAHLPQRRAGQGTRRLYAIYKLGDTVFAGAGRYENATRDRLNARRLLVRLSRRANVVVPRSTVRARASRRSRATAATPRRCRSRSAASTAASTPPARWPRGGAISHLLSGAQVVLNDPTAPAASIEASGLLAGGPALGRRPDHARRHRQRRHPARRDHRRHRRRLAASSARGLRGRRAHRHRRDLLLPPAQRPARTSRTRPSARPGWPPGRGRSRSASSTPAATSSSRGPTPSTSRRRRTAGRSTAPARPRTPR